MIDLNDTIEVTVAHGNIEPIVTYPSFNEMAPTIKKLLKQRLSVSSKGVKDESVGLRMDVFDSKAIRIDGPKVRQGDEVVDLVEAENWKQVVPPNVKAASAMVFDEVAAELEESEIFGDDNRVTIDTLMGDVTFSFPGYEDAAFAAALKKYVSAERVRQRGRKFRLLGHGIDLAFVKKWCKKVEGVDGELGDLPENWLVSVPRPFVAQETLSDDEVGE